MRTMLIYKVFKRFKMSSEAQVPVQQQVVQEVKPVEGVVQKKSFKLEKPDRPMIFHFHESNKSKTTSRVVTTFVSYDPATKSLRLGASIFRKDANSSAKSCYDNYDRKRLNKTAQERYTNFPLLFSNFTVSDNFETFRKDVRKLVHKYGCSTKRSALKL